MTVSTTLDGFLNRRLILEQPAQGFRIAIDTVLLAAAVPARTGDKALDLGCGVGGAMLCLAHRVPQMHLTGIDAQEELVEICRRNIERNALLDQAEALRHDVANFDCAAIYDHVMMNPPYHDEERHDVSAQPSKRKANASRVGDLGLWISKANAALKPQGGLTLIHRADRLDDILSEMKIHWADLEILPILSKIDAPPKRIIVRARKSRAGGGVIRCCPLILHHGDGTYTDAAENILRHAEALPFVTRAG